MSINSNEESENLVYCLNLLLDKTFILKDYPRDVEWYKFLSRHIPDARERLAALGFDLEHDSDAGVLMLIRDPAYSGTRVEKLNRHDFNITEILILLVLMVMYAGQINIDKTKVVTYGRINDSINANFPEIKAAPRKAALLELKRRKLIHFPGNELREDTQVTLHHSLAFCMSDKQFGYWVSELSEKVVRTIAEPEEDAFCADEDSDFYGAEGEE